MNPTTTVSKSTQQVLVAEDVEERGPLSDRILFWVLKHPYQRVRDLTFVFQRDTSTICRHLRALTKQGLLDVISSKSTTVHQAVYYLTTQGIEHVARLVEGADAVHLAYLWHANETALLRLLPRLPSTLPLQDVVQGLIADAPRMLAVSDGHPVAIRWHWQRDYVHAFERKGRRMTCRADAAVVFRRRARQPDAPPEREEESWHAVLLLIDPGFRGSADLHLMRTRFEQVLRWRESSERWSFYHAFPTLLVLAPTLHQRDLWVQSAQEAAAHLRVAPLSGACAMLTTDSPWRFSWQFLDGSGAGTLQALTSPLLLQAIPPGLLAPKPMTGKVPRKNLAPPIVTGHFEQRAQRLQGSQSDLSTVADGALRSLLLCQRHVELLTEIYASPLIATHELAALLSMEATTLQRYLRDLRPYVHACGEGEEQRLLLSESGLRQIALLLDVPLVHLARRAATTQPWQQRGVGPLQQTMTHTASIYGFLAQLQQQAQQAGEALLWWETTRSLRRYRHQGRWHNLMPDALLGYRAADARMEAWLEWDTGSMHAGPLTVKFEAYAHYIRSHQYRMNHQIPPKLLVVAPHPGREQSLRRIMAPVLGPLPLAIWTTTAPLLRVSRPLAAIWRRVEVGGDEEGEEFGRSRWM